jgi:NifU-like protein
VLVRQVVLLMEAAMLATAEPRRTTLDLSRRPATPAPASALAPRPAPPRFQLSEAQLALVTETIEGMRERFQHDGGDIELDRVEDNTVFVRMTGACFGCQLAAVSVSGVQMKLMETLGIPLRVVPVGMGRG